MVPVLNQLDDKAGTAQAGLQRPTYDGFLASGGAKELWMYQSCVSHGCGGPRATPTSPAGRATPSTPRAMRSRAMEWLSFAWACRASSTTR